MDHPFIGHCKRCKLSKRFDAPEVSRRHKSLRSGFEWRTVHDITRDVSGAAPFQGQSFQGNTVQAVEFHDRPGSMWLKCPAGHNVEFKAVRRAARSACRLTATVASAPAAAKTMESIMSEVLVCGQTGDAVIWMAKDGKSRILRNPNGGLYASHVVAEIVGVQTVWGVAPFAESAEIFVAAFEDEFSRCCFHKTQYDSLWERFRELEIQNARLLREAGHV